MVRVNRSKAGICGSFRRKHVLIGYSQKSVYKAVKGYKARITSRNLSSDALKHAQRGVRYDFEAASNALVTASSRHFLEPRRAG